MRLNLCCRVWGEPIEVRRGGELRHVRGWMETREFATAPASGSPDGDGRCVHAAARVSLAARRGLLGGSEYARRRRVARESSRALPALSPIVARFARYGMAFARILGSSEGILAYEVEGEAGERRSVVFTGH